MIINPIDLLKFLQWSRPTTTKKKAIDLTGLEKNKANTLNSSKAHTKALIGKGIANSILIEPIPTFIKAECEHVISGNNNSWIVLGRDRPGGRLTGFGGRGDTQAGMIDIVVGRMGYQVREVDENNQPIYVNPNFETDASRIYISQKTNIDSNFGLVNGKVGNAKSRSAIGIKADGVRIVAREGIKLITKTDRINSQGGEVVAVNGIDLIAGNDDSDLQPFVKGKNVVELFNRVLKRVEDLTGLVETLLLAQDNYNTVLTAHTHIQTGAPGAPTAPSIEGAAGGIVSVLQHLFQNVLSFPIHRLNIESMKFQYLSPIGGKYINSRHNNVN